MQRLSIAILLNLIDLSISVNDEQRFVQIPCQINVEKGVQYRKITWYKVQEGSDALTGLVMKDLRTHVTLLYKFANQSYEVGDDYSLLVPEAGESDCGRYHCTLWPPLSHYIKEGDYEYYPHGCIKPPQHSKTVTGEKNVPCFNSVPLFLIISGVLFAMNMAIIFLCCKRLKQDKKKKKDIENI